MITDRFDRMISNLNKTVDRQFGTGVRITPMKSFPNGRENQDPTRAVMILSGVLQIAPEDDTLQLGSRSNGGRNDLNTIIPGTMWTVSIATEGIDKLNMPRQKDRVEFPSKAELGVFRIAHVQYDDGKRATLILTKIGA